MTIVYLVAFLIWLVGIPFAAWAGHWLGIQEIMEDHDHTPSYIFFVSVWPIAVLLLGLFVGQDIILSLVHRNLARRRNGY